MAQKRMFSLSVIDTDLFMEMPVTSRLLYYELGMRADDDGFVANWKKIMKFTGLAEDDLKVLIAKKFIIPFDSGVIVIRHWRINNYLRNDRYTPTVYQKELAELSVDNNNVYELETTEKSTMLPSGIPVVDTVKDSIVKDSIKRPTLEEIKNYIQEKKLNVVAEQFFDYFDTGNWIDAKGNKVKNWKQKLLTWNQFNGKNQSRKIDNRLQSEENVDYTQYYDL